MTTHPDFLTITDHTGTRTIPKGPPAPHQTTAIVRVDPDAILRETMHGNNAALAAYLRTIAPTLDGQPDDGTEARQRGPAGLSTAPELHARNARYFVTIGALVFVAGTLAAGLVQLATLADLLGESWQIPAWLALTGAGAFWTIREIHETESRRTPEGIADTRAGAEAYAIERDADARTEIARAFGDSIRADATARQRDADARARVTDAELARIGAAPAPQRTPSRLIDNRRFAVQWQEEDAGMLTYATTAPATALQEGENATEAPQTPAAPVYVETDAAPRLRPMATAHAAHAPLTADPVLIELLETIDRLYADCARRGDDLITERLPWSARGTWSAEAKRRTDATLKRLDPPLIVAGAGNRYRLNRAARCSAIALAAVRQNWR